MSSTWWLRSWHHPIFNGAEWRWTLVNRRTFLQWLAAGGSTLCMKPGRSLANVWAPRSSNNMQAAPCIVVIFQRGAMDGLAAVTPYKDRHLRRARPSLFVAPGGEKGAVDLDGRFGMHPAMSPLADLFHTGQLAIVHGAGLPIAERSHFDAQDQMETGTPGRKSTASGWMNRAIGHLPGTTEHGVRAVALGSTQPRSLMGSQSVLTIKQVEAIGAHRLDPAVAALYAEREGLMGPQGRAGIAAANKLADVDWRSFQPAGKLRYPPGELASGLRQIAMLLKAGFPLALAHVDSPGWDMHSRLGGAEGQFARVGGNFAETIATFWQDLGSLRKRVVLLSLTEFGRTVAENGAAGTDHGRGSCFFVLGDRVKGGWVLGQVPVLAKDNLVDDRDLPVTVDYRHVVGEILHDHLGMTDQTKIFPQWRSKRLGLFT